MDVLEILRASVEKGANDVILSVGSPVTFHVHGSLESFDPDRVLEASDTQDLIYQFLDSEQRKQIETELELDIGYHVPDLARFRVSVYRQKGTLAAVLRLIPLRVPHYTEIGLSEGVLQAMANQSQGLLRHRIQVARPDPRLGLAGEVEQVPHDPPAAQRLADDHAI